MNTLYNLSGFFRSLGTDASLADACAFQMRVLSRENLVRLRDCALDLVRIIELAIGAKDDADEVTDVHFMTDHHSTRYGYVHTLCCRVMTQAHVTYDKEAVTCGVCKSGL